ncbi:MAG: hypothetical protein CL536_03415 [Alcaligenaceae bacterium]|nr:hypothetical protein [Alcaligenaceae bacterium]
MTDQIKPGDLVMVVKPTPCCGNRVSVGRLFPVEIIGFGNGRCILCGAGFPDTCFAAGQDRIGYHLNRLKKLNPPADEESREKTKELEAV